MRRRRQLIHELRRREFTIFVVTGGGTEFVRSISHELYGVPPEAVVGTLIEYEVARQADDRLVLRRTARVLGQANEGAAKVTHIQTQLGRRPILAAGNTGGDREMIEWATAVDGPCLGLVVDHDDDEREFRYAGTAETFAESESIIQVAERLGWTVVSMARDWSTVFPQTRLASPLHSSVRSDVRRWVQVVVLLPLVPWPRTLKARAISVIPAPSAKMPMSHARESSPAPGKTPKNMPKRTHKMPLKARVHPWSISRLSTTAPTILNTPPKMAQKEMM